MSRFSISNIRQKNRKFILLLIVGIMLSLCIHFYIFKKIALLEISSFNPASFDRIVPRRFHLERVDINPDLLKESKKTKPSLKPEEVILSEKINFSNKEEAEKNYYQSKPDSFNESDLSEEKPEAINKIIPEALEKPNEPLISFNDKRIEGSDSMENVVSNQASSLGNYSQIDQLVDQKKSISSQTAPILLPTDLLFEYDEDRLKPEAEKSLEKLAILIQRNPNAKFIIEGFTDSFGSNEYNLNLSARRAESIKQWLISKQAINQQQIESCGLGKSHFIVPSTGDIQAQRLNRRVEIVIRQ